MIVPRLGVLTALLIGNTSVAAAQTMLMPIGLTAITSVSRVVMVQWPAQNRVRGSAGHTLEIGARVGIQNVPPAYVEFGRSVTIAWDAPVSGLPLTQYTFEAGRSPGGIDAGILQLPSDSNSFTFNAASQGTYYFRLRAVNASGTSEPSEEVMLVICSSDCTELPGPVTQLASQVSGREVSLAWQAPQSGATVTDYLIEVGSSNGLVDLGQFPTGTLTTLVTIADVSPGTYFIRIRASTNGNLGPPSNEVVVIVQ